MTRGFVREPALYVVLPSRFGPLGIVWLKAGDQAIVLRVILPGLADTVEARVKTAFSNAQQGSHPAIRDLGNQMQAFLEGEPVDFALDSVALENCSAFQQRVLVAEHGIPRGWVSTYGLIAAHLGIERASRAVGSALAHNPFPLIIPCHRAIRSSGELGGYQGGLDMKRRLLEMEGVAISKSSKVIAPRLYYSRRELMHTRYAHTNLIAHDWRRLSEFYTVVFGCTLVPPQRDYRGAEIDALTRIPGVHLQGAHLRLPGYGESGPTLEIFQYDQTTPGDTPAINRPGFAHIAFEVEDVTLARDQVITHGGHGVGEVVTLTTRTGRQVTVCYVTDPEGNGIELQRWAPE